MLFDCCKFLPNLCGNSTKMDDEDYDGDDDYSGGGVNNAAGSGNDHHHCHYHQTNRHHRHHHSHRCTINSGGGSGSGNNNHSCKRSHCSSSSLSSLTSSPIQNVSTTSWRSNWYNRKNGTLTIVYDDMFFRLYYRFTTIILLIISIIIVLREWSVDSIDCNIPPKVITEVTGVGGEISYYRLNAYCKMHNRFIPLTEMMKPPPPPPPMSSLSSNENPCEGGGGEANEDYYNFNEYQPQQQQSSSTSNRGHKSQTIPKYQWFSLIMFTASILIYIPHLLWKCSNRTMIQSVVGRFRGRQRSSFRRGGLTLDHLIHLSLQSSEHGNHQFIFCAFYLILKLLNFAILLVLIIITNWLLQEQFFQYPLYFFDKLRLSSSSDDGVTPSISTQGKINCINDKNVLTMTSTTTTTTIPTLTKQLFSSITFVQEFQDIFPKSSLCPYSYLDQQTSQTKTVLVNCLMPINSLLEQIFLFLWFWYALLCIFTILDFLRYFLIGTSRTLRSLLLRYNTNSILSEQTYEKCSASFSTWLFTTIVLINNQSHCIHHNQHHPPQQQQQQQQNHNHSATQSTTSTSLLNSISSSSSPTSVYATLISSPSSSSSSSSMTASNHRHNRNSLNHHYYGHSNEHLTPHNSSSSSKAQFAYNSLYVSIPSITTAGMSTTLHHNSPSSKSFIRNLEVIEEEEDTTNESTRLTDSCDDSTIVSMNEMRRQITTSSNANHHHKQSINNTNNQNQSYEMTQFANRRPKTMTYESRTIGGGAKNASNIV